jgi:hypothetical protein
MVQRKCPKCDAIFDRKSTYDYHINKVFDCSTKKSNQENLSEKKNCDNTYFNDLSEYAKICQNMPFCAETVPKYAENSTKINLEIKNEENLENNVVLNYQDLCCQYCKKNFSSKSTLTRHLKSNCKIKKENDEEKENIFKLLLEKDFQYKEELKNHKEEMEELKKQNKMFEEQNKKFEKQNKMLMDKIDKLINTKNNVKLSTKTTNNSINSNNTITNMQNNNSNNTNNIVMVNFGKEDLSIIDERQFIEKIVKKNNITGVKIPDEVLKIIHFNPQYPQLSNIYISDINREKCMVYEDGEWKLSNIDNIPQIMDKICIFSKDQIDILREKYPNNKAVNDRLDTVEKYNNYIDDDFVQELREDDDYNNNKLLIERAEDFQKYTYNTIKKTLYNEGKKLKKNNKVK